VAPSNALESILAQIWESLLDLRPVGTRDDWQVLGGDSLRAVHMIERLQEALGRPVQLSVLLEARTIEQLARAVLQEQPADLRQPVVSLHSSGTRPPFYFLHGDYWSDGVYCLPLARFLSPDQPLVLLPPAGLDGRPAPRSIEEMAEHHVGILTAIQPHGPYRLGRNCNGGQVAYEMARLLRRRGERIERLVMVRSLGHTAELWLPYRLARGIAAAGVLGGTHPVWRRRLIQFRAAWSRADTAGRLRLLGSKLARLSRLARPEAEPTERNGGEQHWRERLRDIYMQAAREYVPGSYDGTVILCWPEQDGETPEAARRWWQRVARSVDLRVVPGDHLSYATVHVEGLARILTEVLG
jgi:thioesterase domain-containing protein